MDEQYEAVKTRIHNRGRIHKASLGDHKNTMDRPHSCGAFMPYCDARRLECADTSVDCETVADLAGFGSFQGQTWLGRTPS